MSGKTGIFILAITLFLAGCSENGPQATLDKMASALNNNNGQEFMAYLDMPLYTENFIQNFTHNDAALNSLNNLGNMLGLGPLDNLIGSIVDFRAHLQDKFVTGVTSGELMAKCKVAITPDCPWYPASLRDAEIVQVNENAAIAKVTTPARLTSWLALCKKDKQWLVVGMAVLEKDARSMAVKGMTGQGSGSTDGKGKTVNL